MAYLFLVRLHEPMSARKVAVFFYGSYMNRDVLEEVDLAPQEMRVATLRGFDIRIGPLANLVHSADQTVYGILTTATHAELERLYAHAREILGGTYLPEAVVVQTLDGNSVPALCYIASSMQAGRASNDYIDRIVAPARAHGFPSWYVSKLESFRPK